MVIDSDIVVTILGSNAAVPAHGRFPSGQLLKAGADICLIDCGEGTQFRLQQYKLPIGKIRYIFISHLHGDHVLGLAPLITTWQLTGRNVPLDIWSPAGLKSMIDNIFIATGCKPSFPINFHVIPEGHIGSILKTEGLEVRTFPLTHRIPTSGYRFFRLNKKSSPPPQSDVTNPLLSGCFACSYAYCSDTALNLDMANHLAEVDLMYHEATFLDEHLEKAFSTGHSTASQAASIAKLAGARGLLMGHFSARYKEINRFLDEAKMVFNPCYLAIEGRSFHVTRS